MKICRSCNAKFDTISWRCPSCNHEPGLVEGHYLLNPELGDDLGFQQASFAKLFELEAANFWFRSRTRIILWAIKKYFSDARRMLEVGCGTGFVLSGINSAFPQLSLTGSDISSVGLSYAAKRVSSNVEMVQFDVNSIPFEDEFDLIGAFDVLEHVETDNQVLMQMYGATVAGGGVIITVPQHQFLWSQADVQACHKRRYDAQELKEKVLSAGFDVVRVTSFVTLLFPAMLISRSLKKAPEEYDPHDELNLPGLLNNLFEKILDIERMMIRAGINMPFGGSLLLIARKV